MIEGFIYDPNSDCVYASDEVPTGTQKCSCAQQQHIDDLLGPINVGYFEMCRYRWFQDHDTELRKVPTKFSVSIFPQYDTVGAEGCSFCMSNGGFHLINVTGKFLQTGPWSKAVLSNPWEDRDIEVVEAFGIQLMNLIVSVGVSAARIDAVPGRMRHPLLKDFPGYITEIKRQAERLLQARHHSGAIEMKLNVPVTGEEVEVYTDSAEKAAAEVLQSILCDRNRLQ